MAQISRHSVCQLSTVQIAKVVASALMSNISRRYLGGRGPRSDSSERRIHKMTTNFGHSPKRESPTFSGVPVRQLTACHAENNRDAGAVGGKAEDAVMADTFSTDGAPGVAPGLVTGDEVVDGLMAALDRIASRTLGTVLPESSSEPSSAAVASPKHTIAEIRKCALCHRRPC